jgi:hypothetical protein
MKLLILFIGIVIGVVGHIYYEPVSKATLKCAKKASNLKVKEFYKVIDCKV